MHPHDTVKLPAHTRGEEAGPRHAQVGSQDCKLSPAKGRTHTARGSGVPSPSQRGENSLADSCQPRSPSCFSESFWKRSFTTRLGPKQQDLVTLPKGSGIKENLHCLLLLPSAPKPQSCRTANTSSCFPEWFGQLRAKSTCHVAKKTFVAGKISMHEGWRGQTGLKAPT